VSCERVIDVEDGVPPPELSVLAVVLSIDINNHF